MENNNYPETQKPSETNEAPANLEALIAPVPDTPHKGINKKLAAFIIAGVILVVAGTVVALVTLKSKDKQPARTSTTSQAQETPQPTIKKNIFFFVNNFKQPRSENDPYTYNFKFITPTDNNAKDESLITSQAFITSVADSNLSVQFTDTGDYFAYATGDEPGIGAPTPKPNSYKLHFGKWGSGVAVVLADKEPSDILDWKLTSDGKEILFVQQITDGNKNVKSIDLYRIDLATKQVASVGKLTRPQDRTHSKLFEVKTDKTVRFYSSIGLPAEIYETKYDRSKQKVTYKKVVGAGQFEWGGFMQDSLSPDGTKLLYDASHTGIGKVIVYLMDINNGAVQKLLDPSDKTLGHYGGYWSPDSKSVLFNTSPFGGDAQERKGFKNQVFTTNITSKAVQIIAENSSPGGGYTANYPTWYTSNSWSSDGSYVSYILDKKLYFYDLTSKKIVDKLTTDLGEGGFDSQSSFGWLEQ